MNEEWKKIEGYSNYSVSNLGNVRNDNTGKILRPFTCDREPGRCYLSVKLFQGKHVKSKNMRIHRLVAQAFIPNLSNKREVNHKDGDKRNNAASNLEWCSRSENMRHSFQILHQRHNRIRKVIRIEDGIVFNSITEATRACGLKSYQSIQYCLSGRNHTAGGYHWKYYEEIEQ